MEVHLFKCLCILLLAGLCGGQESEDEEVMNYDGYKVIRVIPKSENQVRNLRNIESIDGMKFWRWPGQVYNYVDIMVAPETETRLLEKLKSLRLRRKTLVEDVGAIISAQKEAEGPEPEKSEVAPEDHIKNSNYFKRYQSYGNMEAKLKLMAKQHRDVFCFKAIGHSSENRSIYLAKISKDSEGNRPIILLDAGHSARDWITHSTIFYLMAKLVDSTRFRSASEMSFDEGVLDRFDFWFVPNVNPDGYEYSRTIDRLWRKSRANLGPRYEPCKGIDIGRNYPRFWNWVGPPRPACEEVFRGFTRLSEPETQAMVDVIKINKERIAMYISLNSYGQEILAPWAHTNDFITDLYDKWERVAVAGIEAIRTYRDTEYKFAQYSKIYGETHGTSLDEVQNKNTDAYPYVITLPDTGDHGYLIPPREIVPIGEETYRGIVAMAEALNFTRWDSSLRSSLSQHE